MSENTVTNFALEKKFVLQKNLLTLTGLYVIIDYPERLTEDIYTATRLNFYEARALKRENEVIRTFVEKVYA